MSEPLVREIVLGCSPQHAFRVFTEHVDLWWPTGHRRSAEGRLAFETAAGGRLVERNGAGDEWTMARLIAFEPPNAIAMDWFPGSPDAATRVEISFRPEGSGTLISIVHSAPPGAAEAVWPARVALFERGWTAVLSRLSTHISDGG